VNILIAYYLPNINDRKTLSEHLYSFRHYSGERYYYLNAVYGIPRLCISINFDLVIFHYTFLAYLRYGKVRSGTLFQTCKDLSGYKVAIPQDEYQDSDRLNEFFLLSGVKTVFTCLPESEWQKVYPRQKSGLEHYLTVFTGYVDEIAAGKLARLNPSRRIRPIDVGYRARKNPYWLGKFGMIKWQLTEKFLNAPVQHNLKLDLSNDPRDVFYGDKWYGFLSNCRVVLGCESGASLHDPDGSIMSTVDRYMDKHPVASFEEVEEACFPMLDGNLELFALSPRHFEACMTRTCQALVEGEYGGIFKPGIHYIEIKKDWSNIADVLRQIEDVDYCERIADNAYRDIIESDLYTYRKFVEMVINHAREVSTYIPDVNRDDARYLDALERRERHPFVFSPFAFLIVYVKFVAYRMLVRLNLHEDYRKIASLIGR
jgi:hypothetical protein